jgi:WD40 repeat protein
MRFALCLLTTFALCLPARAQDDKKEDEPPEVEGKVRLALETGGHTSNVMKVLFTPDSSQIITLSADQSIRLWDVESGEVVNVMYPPPRIFPVTARLSPDGQRLAVFRDRNDNGKRTFAVLLIAPAEGRVERVLTGPATVGALAFSADGKRLATVGGNKEGCVWNLDREGTEPEKTFTSPGIGRCIAFAPDGTRLALSGEWSGVLDLDGKEPHKFFAGAGGDKVVWSADGKTIAFSTGKGLRLWEPEGKQRAQAEEKVGFGSVAISADSKTVLVGEMHAPEGAKARAMAFDVSGKPGKVFVRGPLLGQAPPTKPAKPPAKPPTPAAHPLDDHVHDCALSPNGEMAATVGRLGGHHLVQIWRTSDAKQLKRMSSRTWFESYDVNVGWSPDNRMVIVGTERATRAFLLDDLPRPDGKPPVPALRLVGKPPAAAPALLTEARGLGLVKSVDGKEIAIFKNNKRQTTIKLPRTIYHATFFGKDQVVVNGSYAAFDAQTGKPRPALTGHNSYVLHMAVSPNHKYLASVSWDQVLCVHTPARPEPLLNLYVAGNEWVVWTPEGYYAASAGGDQLMGWIVETSPDQMCTFHPASHFRARFYRPDAIKLLLKEGSFEKALAKADEARGNKETTKVVAVADSLPPEVEVSPPEPKADAPRGTVTVKATAKPAGKDPITEMQLLIDDRPYTGEGGLFTVAKPAAGPVAHTWELQLPQGKHAFRVLARTSAGLGTSRGMTRDVESDKSEGKKDPALYLLAVGIDEYPGRLALDGAVNDATELAKAFKKFGTPTPFREIEVKVLTNKQATRDGIREGLKWLKDHQTAGDIAAFFYAGHGARADGEFYLIPQDIDPDAIPKTGLARAEIKKTLQGMPGRILVILDACHTGAVGLLFDDLSRELTDEDCGVVVICAAVPSEEAKEKNGRGNLTKSITEALSGEVTGKDKEEFKSRIGVSPKDRCLYLHHLQAYVVDRVVNLSDDTQHPTAVMPPWLKSYSLSKPERPK